MSKKTKDVVIDVPEKDEATLVAETKRRLRMELLERSSHDPEKAARIRKLMREAEERVAMPRTAAEPTPIRRWAVDRKALFGPVAPAARRPQYYSSEVLALAISGDTPGTSQVELLGSIAIDPSEANRMLGWIARQTMTSGTAAEGLSDADALAMLINASHRPADLETLINAALMLEFAAAHVRGWRAMAPLLTMASVLWWAAGQRTPAIRALRVPLHYRDQSLLTKTMVAVLRYRKRAPWILKDHDD